LFGLSRRPGFFPTSTFRSPLGRRLLYPAAGQVQGFFFLAFERSFAMNTMVRLTFSAAILVALYASVCYLCPACSADLGLNIDTWFELPQQLNKNLERGEALEQQTAKVQRHILTQNQIIDQILDRKIDLLEAACQLQRAKLPLSPSQERTFEMVYGGSSEMERYGRQVIALTRWRSSQRAVELEREMKQFKGKG
jgi:hypothetical protein